MVSYANKVLDETFQHLSDFVDEQQSLIVRTCLAGLGFFLVRKWLKGGYCYSTITLHGKTVIVTGASTGIGKEIARNLAKRGARVILACRNFEKGITAANEILREIPEDCRGGIVVRHLDLASFSSIRDFTQEILETESHIHILVNNAGVMAPKGTTEDGLDLVFGTNHLGPFLLTNLLLDRIKKSVPSKIITMSSHVHKMIPRMIWEDLNLDEGAHEYTPMKAYCQSKLANVLFSAELCRRLLGTGVTTYAIHPGFVRTELSRERASMFSYPTRVCLFLSDFLFAKSPSQGAQTAVFCAVDPMEQNRSGHYYRDCHDKKPSKAARSIESAKRLWEISEQMTRLHEYDVVDSDDEDCEN